MWFLLRETNSLEQWLKTLNTVHYGLHFDQVWLISMRACSNIARLFLKIMSKYISSRFKIVSEAVEKPPSTHLKISENWPYFFKISIHVHPCHLLQ